MELQITRMPFDVPTCEIINIRENIEDYIIDDFKINNYTYHGKIKMDMKA